MNNIKKFDEPDSEYIKEIIKVIEENNYELMEFKYEGDDDYVIIPRISPEYSKLFTFVAILDMWTDVNDVFVVDIVIIAKPEDVLKELKSLDQFNSIRFWDVNEYEWHRDIILLAIYSTGIKSYENIIDKAEKAREKKRRRDNAKLLLEPYPYEWNKK